MDIINYNKTLYDNVIEYIKNVNINSLKIFVDSNDIKNKIDKEKYKNEIRYNIIIVGIITFGIITYMLFYYNNKYKYIILLSAIISILSDGNIIKNPIINKIDIITATLTFIIIGSIFSKNMNPIVILLLIYIITRFLKLSRNTETVKEWELKHNLWHFSHCIIILIYVQIYQTL